MVPENLSITLIISVSISDNISMYMIKQSKRNCFTFFLVQNGTSQLLCRFYTPKSLTVDEIKTRVMRVCQEYDKVNAEKVLFSYSIFRQLLYKPLETMPRSQF